MVYRRERKQGRMKYGFIISILFVGSAVTAQVSIPPYYKQSQKFNTQLKTIVHEVGLDSSYDAGEDGKEQISFAVIDLTGKKPVLGGVNFDNLIILPRFIKCMWQWKY